jgi:hypothetical protein
MTDQRSMIAFSHELDGTWIARIDGTPYCAESFETLVNGLKHHFHGDSDRLREIHALAVSKEARGL